MAEADPDLIMRLGLAKLSETHAKDLDEAFARAMKLRAALAGK